MNVLIATSNPNKVREFRQMLGDRAFRWSDLSAHDSIEPVEETGSTFRANACLKAGYYAGRLHCWALADDSGLEVDALRGEPGIHSARFAEMHAKGSGDAANNALLLARMSQVPDGLRTARFVCVLALADPQGRIVLTALGTVEGQVGHVPRGDNGFGYDPLFIVTSLQRRMAELTPEEKHRVSHRGRALVHMKELMRSARLM